MCKHGVDSRRDGSRRFFQHQPPFGPQGRKAQQKKIRDYLNVTKIKELVSDLEIIDRRPILLTKNRGNCLNVRVLRQQLQY